MDPTQLSSRPRTFAELRATMEHADWGMLSVGGVAMVLSGVLVLMVAVTSVMMGPPPPEDSQLYFVSIAAHPRLSSLNFGLYALADLLMVAVLPALYLAFKRWDRTALVHGLSLVAVYLVLDLGVTELNSLTLVRLGHAMMAASGNAQLLAVQSAASFPLATLPLATFFSYVVSSVGLLIVTVVMLRAGFGRWVSALGIVAFAEGIIGGFYVVYPPLALLLLPCLVTFGVWLVISGAKLRALGAAAKAA
jgi:hypothetical protein